MDRRTFVKSLPALAVAAGASKVFAGNKPELAALLKLRPEQRALFAQTVGYPAQG